ncbi:MAG: collagen-binding domain-containing protein, partial [Fimbriimonadaceae bacterium]|nr:collagen-binding domain-containing protein [Fimbriimonadaceae bacterium]
MKSLRGLVLALAGLSSTVAFAGDLGVANGFNAFIFENANTTGGHSEGAMAVGGNWAQGYESF